MHLTAQDIHRRYAPSGCDLRVCLDARGTKGADPSEFDQVIMRLGKRHEVSHLATFANAVNLQTLSRDERINRTIALVNSKTPVLYQGVLAARTTIDGVDSEVVGEPDFLIAEEGGYVIRDVKMARRIAEDNHREILLQLQFYGWLFEQVFGSPPLRLEILNGQNQIMIVPGDNGGVLRELGELVRLKLLTDLPYSPVGWSKCTGCGYHDHCWPLAEAAKDVSLVYNIDQGLSVQLHAEGVKSYVKLIEKFDEPSLRELKRPWGTKTQRVGARAGMILRRAEVMVAGKEVVLEAPQIPKADHYVMFDLEGIPPHLDELDKIYLWGMQVFGRTLGEFMPAVAGFDTDGDQAGWNEFLANAETVFQKFGDIPFVHWHSYEKTHIKSYIGRHGDPKGIAARVLSNLLDLLPIAQDSILLPLPSYSLKVVEKYVGFERTQEEYGGSWSIAQYIEATETHDEVARTELVDAILLYNKEDLAATWAVFEWLRNKTAT